MPIFDDIIWPKLVWPAEAHRPLRRAHALIERLRTHFPEIFYDVYWETRLIKAQAYIGEKGCRARLFGGLGRHRRVGVKGIVFAIAHEIGHHQGARRAANLHYDYQKSESAPAEVAAHDSF